MDIFRVENSQGLGPVRSSECTDIFKEISSKAFWDFYPNYITDFSLYQRINNLCGGTIHYERPENFPQYFFFGFKGLKEFYNSRILSKKIMSAIQPLGYYLYRFNVERPYLIFGDTYVVFHRKNYTPREMIKL